MSKELYTYLNEKLGNFSEKVVEFSRQMEVKQLHFEEQVKENEKNTLWKIKDCEKLLESRVSDQYVNDAIKTISEKLEMDVSRNNITKQMKFREEREMERLFKSFKDLEKKILTTNTFLNDSFTSFRS